MAKLREIAHYIRSKNAGPFWATVEIFCGDKDRYEQVCSSDNISVKKVAELYKVKEEEIQEFYLPSIFVIKYSFPRPVPSGWRYDRDMHYGQQYRLIAEEEV